MVFGKNKSIGQYRKAGHAANKKNKTCTRITTKPSSQRWTTKKFKTAIAKNSVSTITYKTTPTANHFQPAPIDNSVFNKKETGTPRKDDSDKASIMAKSREEKNEM